MIGERQDGALRCYLLDQNTWLIAYSVDDADMVYREHSGASWEESCGDAPSAVAEVLPGDRRLRMHANDGDSIVGTRTVDDWIAIQGRCFLGSVDW